MLQRPHVESAFLAQLRHTGAVVVREGAVRQDGVRHLGIRHQVDLQELYTWQGRGCQ